MNRAGESEGSIHLQIVESRHGENGSEGTGPTTSEPQNSIKNKDSSNTSVSPTTRPASRPAPEKQLTLFALRLAVLEKAATGLGTLGFIWATVVLLGGFAVTLDNTDFWFITIILLIEGTRIFSRSHELEWQHQATWSIAGAGINSFRFIRSSGHFIVRTVKAIFRPIAAVRKPNLRSREITESTTRQAKSRTWHQKKKSSRTWTTSDVPLLPYATWVFVSKNVSKVLYWLQLASAITCMVLSLMKLVKRNFGEIAKGETDMRNRNPALLLFYSLALAEASLFLLEKVYWEWKVIYRKLLEKVNRECEFDQSGMVSIRRFFYDAYSLCVNGSMFDGLKMDMISFAMDLLASNSPDEQLIGARILQQFSTSQQFSEETLQKIGISIEVIERLVEMLNWKDPLEEEIRNSAAEILSKLAGKEQNALRVAGIPGAMESIASLLHNDRSCISAADEISGKKIIFDNENYGFWNFNHLGLLILKKLARDHDNCGKIGNTRGLLAKIIDFTHAKERWLRDGTVTASQILTVKRSLQLVMMLVSQTGNTGKHLRQGISEVVFTISNIRNILRYGEKQPKLQKLGIEILTSLALEEEATERIGGTGGVFKELFNIFFKHEMPEDHNNVRISAGEALSMLTSESSRNCRRILKLKVIEKLVDALEVPLLRINVARILRNLCIYGGSDCFEQLKGVTAAAPTILGAIMVEENKLQEVMIGLAAQVFKFMTPQESSTMFLRAGVQEAELAHSLVQILKKYHYPPIKVPRIRRFVIELAIWMMKDKEANIQIFKDLIMERQLESITETTSELESFNIFSGTVGLSRHSETIHSLVETAMELLDES